MLAQRFASASNPAFATVVNHVLVPSAVSARPRSTGVTAPRSTTATAAADVAAGDPEVAGEVVARSRRDDCQHTLRVGDEPASRSPCRRHRTRSRRARAERVPRCDACVVRAVETCSSTSIAERLERASTAGTSFRARPRPAAGLITAVHCTDRDDTSASLRWIVALR